jgi:apolipoprotein N-acyltransferase
MATAVKKRPSSTKGKSKKKQVQRGEAPAVEFGAGVEYATVAGAGAILGLSAPGMEQWYLAWCGLVPLLLVAVGSRNVGHAFLRGLVFGLGYNLVYLSWYLGLHPLEWMGLDWWQSIPMSVGAWFVAAVQQALIISVFAMVCRVVPLTGGFMPRKEEEGWKLPALVFLPLAWVLLNNKVLNAHDLLGVPWPMVEYSQYKQLAVIQAASVVGGIGLAFVIVMVNTALAGMIASASSKLNWKALAAPTFGDSIRQALVVALAVTLMYAAGLSALARSGKPPHQTVSVLQGNINIDMQKREHGYTLAELFDRYKHMSSHCGKGLCIWTESALPTYLRQESLLLTQLRELSRKEQLDMVVGSMDKDAKGKPYNSAFGITSDGTVLPSIYHKRYLVPFGEYMPGFVKYLPEFVQKLTNTPAGGGFASGDKSVVLSFTEGKVAPLICFECMSPELVSESVREGGELIVNISDLAWFHDSICGDQMIAFSTLRAVENGRYVVFAANSGPSAIISPSGKILSSTRAVSQKVMEGKVEFENGRTPFTFWFR